MPLQSPGVEVTVIDESFYTPAEPGTTPLIVIATQQDKSNPSGTGTAPATTKSRAGEALRITSQKELVDLFGVPFFEKTASATPIHGGERNEYGLLSAYSLLGVSNSVFVTRADVDLGQLQGASTAPGANPSDGAWWVDTKATTFGIQQWNSAAVSTTGGQKFEAKTPLVLTDADQSKLTGVGGDPLGSVGSIGDYAVVFETVDGSGTFSAAAETARIYFKSAGNTAAGVAAGEWVLVGSNKWAASHPTIVGTVVVGTLTNSDTFLINGTVINNIGTSLTSLVARINGLLNSVPGDDGPFGITAKEVSGRLQLFSDGLSRSLGDSTSANGQILIEAGTGNVLGNIGIIPNLYAGPLLVQQPHTQVPAFKSGDTTPRPSGSVWIKTTEPAKGARWRVKEWSAATESFVSYEAPIFATTTAALFFLDRSGGGVNLPVDTLFVQSNSNEDSGFDTTPATATFRMWRRSASGSTTVTSKKIGAGTVASTGAKSFSLSESVKAQQTLANAIAVTFAATNTAADANLIATAINAAGFVNLEAAVSDDNRLSIFHKLGGDFRILDTDNVIANVFDNPFSINTLAGTRNLFTLPGGSTSAAGPVQTFVVTAVPNPGTPPPNFIFQIDGVNYPVLNLVRGGVYTFDQSAASNTNHQIAFKDGAGNSFTLGVVTTGVAGQPGAKTVFTVPLDAPDNLRYYCVQHGNGMGNIITVTTNVSAALAGFLASNWEPFAASNFSASPNAPLNEPQDGQLWYNPEFSDVDFLVHNGTTFVGLNNFADYANAQVIVSASEPQLTAGQKAQANHLWVSTADLENFPIIYRWNKDLIEFQQLDKTDQVTEDGVLFADARYGSSGATGNTAAAISDLLTSNFLDPDAPDPALFPRGMLLWNLRRSGGNVKRYNDNYINTAQDNPRFNDESMGNYATDRWSTASGNNEDGSGSFGRKAQRKVVVAALKSVVDLNEELRDEERRNFNIIACPGYPELMSNLVNLNIDRGVTAFVVGDTPLRLASDATSLSRYGSNERLVTDNGDDGLVTFDEFLGVFYPNGFTTDLSGSNAVVPASHLMLRTIALSDNVSFPWFAPAGTRRGGITNATSVGFIDSLTGEFQTVALNEGQRDTLYDLKINPITFFNGVGLVNYGQKTRARNASALDRINVARLVVYLRSQLQKLARPFVFEPNDKITREEVRQAVESLLLELVGLRALFDFAVVCDETNNTPSRIDRNELYVDIAIEPVKAIEFIYIPLRVKNTGEI